MSELKQILVIDDHFEMLEFLRSMLELSALDCEVLAVPSAEEGMLELRRTQFDLLITDVRLPGMSGFDLVRRIKRLGQKMPIIMITAYSSSQGKKEAAELEVYQYFQKPLDTDAMLTAVNKALFGEELPTPQSRPVVVEQFDVTVKLRKRLETLQIDTGALLLMLSSISGQVIHSVGGGPRVDHAKLSVIIARNITDSFLLAAEIKSRRPFTLQYHAGERLELYCANVAQDFFLTLFFDATARRGRVGTIWVFTQRAIKDLQKMMPKVAEHEITTAVVVQPVVTPSTETAVPQIIPTPDEPEEEIELAPAINLPTNITIIDETQTAAAETESVTEDFLDIDPDELQALLSGGDEAIDLDAFWDDAFTEDESDEEKNKGLSLEEAMQQGLIPPDDSDT